MKQVIKSFFEKYEKYLSPIALIAGFVWDNLTLYRIDLWVENVIILAYLFISGFIILFLNAHSAGRLSGKIFNKFASFAPFILQFAFGGLFSVFVVFYTKSASFITSWPFLIFLLALLIGNEVFQKKYLRLVFQMSIFFVALFSYSIFAVPIIIGKMGAWVFFLSGLISLVLIAFVIFVLYRLIPERIKERRHLLLRVIGIIYLVFNIFYFTNIIPPIPLSLKEVGVYHGVEKTSLGYKISYELPPWYLFYKDFNPKFHLTSDKPVYIYSAIFAPTKLNTKIVHRWLYFDELKRKWIVSDELGFSIFGGRDGGYRGYSFKTHIKSGKWRVDVITERGQVLGQVKFEVIKVDSTPELKIDLR